MSLFGELGGLGGLVEKAIQNHPGGLSGLMQEAFSEVGGLDGVIANLNAAGLGEKVNSWLGQGANKPITADEIRNALSNAQVKQLAAKLGVPIDQVATVLAQHLPNAVAQASAAGTIQATPQQ